MTVGPGQQFEKVVVHLPEGTHNKTPGLELVGISRAMNPSCFAIGNLTANISTLSIRKIGTTKAYDKRKDFIRDMKMKAGPSQQYYREMITNLDTSNTEKTLMGGYRFLLGWYRSQINLD